MDAKKGYGCNEVEAKVQELLQKMTLKEKVSLMSGKDSWYTVPIERLGIPSLLMTDGPHGVRATGVDDRITGPATSFPTGVSMASSWNTELIERVGGVLAEETRGMGCDILLAPCINIVRHPLGGRNFESYSEDPHVAGRIGTAYVKGLQSKGVGASLKHFACNNQEIDRFRGSSEVDERTLREIYLTAFEMVVKETQPWTVMCSYNRINGVYASENYHLLTEILKEEWGFEGVVISDWGANHTTAESVKGGLDIEMPGPAKYYGGLLVDAVNHWQVDEEAIDRAVTRILRMLFRSGKMDATNSIPTGAVNTTEHQALARELAEESIVLLKNENAILPLNKGKSVAVIGPNAAEMAISGGGSAYVKSPYKVNPLEALQAKLGEKIAGHEEGTDHTQNFSVVNESVLEGNSPSKGLQVEFFPNTDFAGSPFLTRCDDQLCYWWGFGSKPEEKAVQDGFSARWTGKFKAVRAGCYTFQLEHSDTARLYLDGKLMFESSRPAGSNERSIKQHATVELVTGQLCEIRVENVKPTPVDDSLLIMKYKFSPGPTDNRIDRAAELAGKCDVALVFVGMPDAYETEGWDRMDMELPGRQNELVSAVAKANPNTVVVLNAGAPVTMPWINEVAAVVQAFYPGLEGGNAIANVLVGEANPSGKLTVTYPERLEDTPAYINYPGGREVRYGEGIFVGYRYYDFRKMTPLFPFGHGLSYTTFAYESLQVPATFKDGETVRVSVTVKNTGKVAGKEVVHLYVGDKETSIGLLRPVKELKGFQKVSLNPGESKTIEFELDRRAFAFYDPKRKTWATEPGEFEIMAGSSSRDIRASKIVTLEK